MNMKLKKILDEIQKTEERIAEWQEHLRELNVRKKQMEDMEIIKSIRSMKLDSRSLLKVLDGIQKGTMIFSLEDAKNVEKDKESIEDNKNVPDNSAGNQEDDSIESKD